MVAETRHKKNRSVLYGVYIFLLLPAVVGLIGVREKPLKGAFYLEGDTELSFQSWFTGNYQEQKNKYLTHRFGFHNTYVRLNSEIDFRLFRKAHARFVVVGKDNYLFESDYIRAYNGLDFLGEDKIGELASKMKCVQDSMQSHNKLMLVALAPGKASFYPEYIPEQFKTESRTTNYSGFATSLQQMGINCVDFNKYFVEQKSKSTFPLYPQYGIHWSNYGSILAFDSIVSFAKDKLHKSLPELVIDEVHLSDSLQEPDDDVAQGLNLLSHLKTFPMAYPSYHVGQDTGSRKLNLLVVSDSFWWYIYGTGLPDKVFNSRFWFYNEEMYPESFTSPTFVKETDYYSRIREADVIVILHSESTLYKFGGGFVEMCYETFCRPDSAKQKIQAMKGSIRATPSWFDQVKIKASQKNISTDSMLTLDALYTLERK